MVVRWILKDEILISQTIKMSLRKKEELRILTNRAFLWEWIMLSSHTETLSPSKKFHLALSMENASLFLVYLVLVKPLYLSAWQVKSIPPTENWLSMASMWQLQVASSMHVNKLAIVLNLTAYSKASRFWNIWEFTLHSRESIKVWERELSKSRLMIWTYVTMLTLRQINFLEETKESCQFRWLCLETLHWFSWTSHQLVLILKLNDLCGTLWQRSRHRESKVVSSSQLIPWKRLRPFAQRWVSWSRASSNVLVHPHTSKINTVQVMS